MSGAIFPNGNTFLSILLRSILKFPQFTFAIVCNTYYLGYPSQYFWEGWKKTPSLTFPFCGYKNVPKITQHVSGISSMRTEDWGSQIIACFVLTPCFTTALRILETSHQKYSFDREDIKCSQGNALRETFLERRTAVHVCLSPEF